MKGLVSIMMVIFVIAASTVIAFSQAAPPAAPVQSPQLSPADSAKQAQADSIKAAQATADSLKKVDANFAREVETKFWSSVFSDSTKAKFKGLTLQEKIARVGNETEFAYLMSCLNIPKQAITRGDEQWDGYWRDRLEIATMLYYGTVQLGCKRDKQIAAQLVEAQRNDSALVSIMDWLAGTVTDLTNTTMSRLDSFDTNLDRLKNRVTALEEAIKKAQFNDDAFMKALMRADLQRKDDPKWEGVFKKTGLTK